MKITLSAEKFREASLLAVVTVAALCMAPVASGQAPASPGEDYIVGFRAGTSKNERAAAVARAGARLRFNYSIIDAVTVTVPNANALAALQRDVSVTSITPDHRIYAIPSPDVSPAAPPTARPGGGGGSTSEVVPEGVIRVGAPTATSNGAGIGAVTVDTGIDLDHPDLAANIAAMKFDAFGGNCDDGNGHGTHVSGTIAAVDNTIDVIGVAPKATLYCGRALDNSGSGNDSTLIYVLDKIYENHNLVSPNMRVVNMSLGRSKMSGDDGGPLHQAIQRLYGLNIVPVAAAGNDPYKEVKDMVPAGFSEVIAVASSTAMDGTNSCSFFSGKIYKDTASYFTTDGKLSASNIGVTISAPGADKEDINKACFLKSVGILSTKAGGGTTRMSGTSMAAPHVSGAVARILQAGLATTVEGVRSHLRSTASQKGTAPKHSPSSAYSYDVEQEGIAQAP